MINIAYCTFLELIRSKTLFAALLFAIIFTLISSLLGSVTLGDKTLVVKSLGLAALSLSCVGFAIFSGTKLIDQELKARTIFTVISRPIKRSSYVFGKGLGMWFSSIGLLLVMSFILILWSLILGDKKAHLLVEAMLMMSFELLVVSALAIFFTALFVTPILGGLATGLVWVIGRTGEYLYQFAENLPSVLSSIVKGIGVVVPQFYRYVQAEPILYGDGFTALELLSSFGYSVCYAGLLLCFAALIFERKNIE
jgi:ABC-type transport system involved in multi-copper enzyme maturation permease subunit